MTRSRALDVVLRLAFGGLLLTMTAVAAAPSCDSSEVPASIDVGIGDTYGAEVSLTITGRGRVTSTPPAIDCPPDCFTRVVLPSGSVDGGDGGITLIAQDTPGAHFVGWSFAEVDLGARAHGPAQCSPTTRKASVPPGVDTESTVVSVPFGQTQGTPPAGHESECASFTSVSLAYAVTAKFSEDPPEPGFDASIDPDDLDVLFFPDTVSEAREIGVTNGYAYWRFTQGGPLSGIAGSYLASNTSEQILAPTQGIRLFDVSQHVVFQTIDDVLHVIAAGFLKENDVHVLRGAPHCLAITSDVENVYCRASLDGGSAIYAWPVTGGDVAAPTLVHAALPAGETLAVDTQRFYFSDFDPLGAGSPQTSVFSVTRAPDVEGGTASVATVANAQYSPGRIAVGSMYVGWLDSLHNGTVSAKSTPKFAQFGPPPPTTGLSGFPLMTANVADPITNDFWVATASNGSGNGWQIYQVLGGMTSATFFRSGNGDIGGIAVDDNYVYWTQSNGRVYRSFKHINEP